MFLALLLAASCTVGHITITAPDPCATAAKIREEWPQVEARVAFVRKGLSLPYQPMSLDEAEFDIIEKPGILIKATATIGLFVPKGYPDPLDKSTKHSRDRIYYDAKDAAEGRTILHEMAHYRYLVECYRNQEPAIAAGHFAHGDAQDPQVQVMNRLINYLWPVPHDYPYFPGLLAQEQEERNANAPTFHRKGASHAVK